MSEEEKKRLIRIKELEEDMRDIIKDSYILDDTVVGETVTPILMTSVLFAMVSGDRDLQVSLLRRLVKYCNKEVQQRITAWLELEGLLVEEEDRGE